MKRKNFKLFLLDNENNRILATKSFTSLKKFAKWFVKNITMFDTRLNFMLGLTPIEIYYNYKIGRILIQNKDTQEWIYEGV